MKRSLKKLHNFTIGATDGEIGKVKECFFDDHSFTIRYFVVETGSWFFGKRVLISPQAITNIHWDDEVVSVNLSKEQVKNSPDIDTDKPVSRQQEIELYKYYPWQSYWGAGNLWDGGVGVTGMMMPTAMPMDVAIDQQVNADNPAAHGDPNLRSTHAITGYNIKATDGDIGDVDDFIIDDNTWKISYLVADTGHWMPGKKVIISPNWVKAFQWDTSEVIVNATVDQVKQSPEYDGTTQLQDQYEANLQNYYGRFITDK